MCQIYKEIYKVGHSIQFHLNIDSYNYDCVVFLFINLK